MDDDDNGMTFRLRSELIDLIKLGVVDQYSSIRMGRNGFFINDQPLNIIHDFFSKRAENTPVDELTSDSHQAFASEQEERTKNFVEAAKHWDEPDREFIDLSGIQDLLGISRSTLHRLRRAGNFPEPAGGGRGTTRWRRSDIVGWFQNGHSSGPDSNSPD